MAGTPDATPRFPIDYDKAEKGDRIEAALLEQVFGCNRLDQKYNMALRRLSATIEDELWMRGKNYTVCIRDYGIAILTDPESSDYNQARFRHHLGGIARSNRKMAMVDTAALSQEARAAHDKNLKYQGMILASVIAAERRIAKQDAPKEARQIEGPEPE